MQSEDSIHEASTGDSRFYFIKITFLCSLSEVLQIVFGFCITEKTRLEFWMMKRYYSSKLKEDICNKEHTVCNAN